MSLRARLDAIVGPYALTLLREATGRSDPLPHLAPSPPAALAPGRTVAFWSLCAGVGTSTTAALVAHRSTAARAPALLVDLDLHAPALALRAGVQAATVADALLRPGRERELVSRWERTPFLGGAPGLHASFDGARVVALVERAAAGRPAVLDLGAGADALDATVLSRCARLFVCAGTRVAQLQAAFCSAPLLSALPVPVALVVVGASDEDAKRIADRLPWPLAAVVPLDDHLARDDFAARAPTLHAIDHLIRAAA
ncbi:MAG TPA: hypothetical protein VFW12_09775 [Candidatus Limnocylindria bacterium]|nr:hypothetical protein [Candidatus Limnocylindria bacterium]